MFLNTFILFLFSRIPLTDTFPFPFNFHCASQIVISLFQTIFINFSIDTSIIFWMSIIGWHYNLNCFLLSSHCNDLHIILLLYH
jgi:hypothetical protein